MYHWCHRLFLKVYSLLFTYTHWLGNSKKFHLVYEQINGVDTWENHFEIEKVVKIYGVWLNIQMFFFRSI